MRYYKYCLAIVKEVRKRNEILQKEKGTAQKRTGGFEKY